MQYLLTKEEYDALKNSPRDERKKVLEEVLTALGEEFLKVPWHSDRFGLGGTMVCLPDMKEAVAATRRRFGGGFTPP